MAFHWLTLYRGSITLSGALFVFATSTSYTARRVPELDNIVYSTSNLFTVDCDSVEECTLRCGSHKEQCLSVMFHRENKYCRGYSYLSNTTEGTLFSTGAEYYTMHYQYVSCPYAQGYMEYSGFCLREVTLAPGILVTEAYAACLREGASVFKVEKSEEFAVLKEIAAANHGTCYLVDSAEPVNSCYYFLMNQVVPVTGPGDVVLCKK